MRNFRLLVALGLIACLSSCSKNKNGDASLFYGDWKASYGDTITFTRSGGENKVIFDYSLNPLMPVRDEHDFLYSDSKLAIHYKFAPTGDFKSLNSFTWVRKGMEFTVQGVEWFNFLSSTTTVFTFTRIR